MKPSTLLLSSLLMISMACNEGNETKTTTETTGLTPRTVEEILHKRETDSIQIMNKTIDLLPEEIRNTPVVQDLYLLNLENVKRLVMNQPTISNVREVPEWGIINSLRIMNHNKP